MMNNLKNKKVRLIISIAILLLAIAFIYIGIMQEEPLMVMRKANFICFECMGLGQ